MVDTISNTKSIRHAGSATTRYGAPPATSDSFSSSKAIAPVAASGDLGRHEQDGPPDQGPQREFAQDAGNTDLRLEISQDDSGKQLVYRFVDAQTGNLVREWDAGEFSKLREYVRAKKIHFLDKKI